MNVIVCLGSNNGILFNNRRVSKDINIFNDIFMYTDKLYVDNFSMDMINYYNLSGKVEVLSINDVEKGNFYFNEVNNQVNNVEKLIVYNFNRSYPHDYDFIINSDLVLESEVEFKGYSHDVITKKVYRCKDEEEV